jgi:hypothetical protein
MMAKQERANHVVFRTVNRHDGSKGIEAHTPEKVLPIHDKAELEAQLKHYAKFLLTLHTTDKVGARRKYVELIRPTLRYYCKKFNVKVPSWLASDSYYTEGMDVATRQKMFGMRPLRIGEFQQLRPVPGVEGVSYPGREADPSEEEAKANG